MKYAIYDEAGLFIEAHNQDRIKELPSSAVELTDQQFEQWQDFKADASRKAVVPAIRPVNAAALKALKMADINQQAVSLLGVIKARYPEDEVQSWDKQESEARAYTANPQVAVPLLSALAAARGLPLTTLVSRVITKADQFATVSGSIIGKRQYCEDQINSLDINSPTFTAQLAAITWPA